MRHLLHACVGAAALFLGAATLASAGESARPSLVLQFGHTQGVTRLAVSPDGRTFASGGLDGTIKLWDSDTGGCLWTTDGHALPVGYLAYSGTGDVLVSCGSAGKTTSDVRLWEVSTGRRILEVTTSGPGTFLLSPKVCELPFSPDGRWIAVPFVDGFKLVSVSQRRVVNVPGFDRDVYRAAWSGDSRRLALVGRNAVTILAVPSLAVIATVPVTVRHDDVSLSSIALDTGGTRLACVNRDGALVLWSVPARRAIWSIPLPGAGVPDIQRQAALRAVAILESEDLVVGLDEYAARAWDAADGEIRYEIPLVPRSGDVTVSSDFRSLVVPGVQPEPRPGFEQTLVDAAIWNLQTGTLQRTIGVPSNSGAFALAPDGRHLVASEAGTPFESLQQGTHAQIWDTATGERRQLSAGRAWSCELVAWGPDGRYLMTGPVLRAWDLQTGLVTSPPALRPERLMFVRPAKVNGAFAMVDGDDLVAYVLEAPQGERKTLTTTSLHVDPKTTTAGAFSADGQVLAIGGRGGRVQVWDSHSGSLLKTFDGMTGDITTIAFDPDGGRLVAGARDGRVAVWDVSSGRGEPPMKLSDAPVRLVQFRSQGDAMNLVAVTADGGFHSWKTGDAIDGGRVQLGNRPIVSAADWPGRPSIVIGDTDGVIRVVDLATGAITESIHPVDEAVAKIGFMATRSTAEFDTVIAQTRYDVVTWDPESDVLSVIPQHLQRRATVLGFQPNGDRLFTGLECLESRSWTPVGPLPAAALVVSGSLGWGQNLYSGRPQPSAYSPTGEVLATANSRGVHLVNGTTGEQIRDLPGHLDTVGAIAFGPGGGTLAVASHNQPPQRDVVARKPDRMELRIWRLDGEPSSSVFVEPKSPVNGMAYLPDGRLVTGDVAGSIRVWDVNARRVTASATVPDSDQIGSAIVSPDGGLLAVSYGKNVALLDLPNLQPRGTLSGHDATVAGLAFSPDGRLLVSGSADGTARLWDVATGEHLATLISLLDDDDWLVVTPDGLFDGSPDAWSRIRWWFGDGATLLPVEAFFAEFYSPGLLADIVAGARPKARRDIAAIDRRPPTVTLRLAEPAAPTVSTRMVRVEVDVDEVPAAAGHPLSSGASDVRLFRNGSLVKVWRGDVLSGKGHARLFASVPIVVGANSFSAYAFNRDSVKSLDARLAITGAESLATPRSAHILAVGVSTYANEGFDLRFAAADAHAFAAETKARLVATGDFDRVDVVELLDEHATRKNILDAIGRLAEAGPDDAVFVFFAGHGIRISDRFCLVPYDLGDAGTGDGPDESVLDRIAAHAISDRDLERAFEPVDAANAILVIDACFAGAVLGEAGVRAGPLNARGLGQLAYEKGMSVLAAAGRDQRAVESSSLGHGVLTYALVSEGLEKAEADGEPADGELYLDEWLEFATRRVPLLHERLSRAWAGREIVHAATDTEGLQTPRLFNRPGNGRRRLRIATFVGR